MLKRFFGRSGSTAPARVADTGTERYQVEASDATFDGMLARLADGSDGFAIVHIDDERNWYLQATSTRRGLVTEAVSNAYLKGTARLTPEIEDGLHRLGWHLPSFEENWSRDWPDWPAIDPDGPRDLLLATLPLYRRRVGESVIIEAGT